MSILGLKCAPDAIVWVVVDDSVSDDVKISKGAIKLSDKVPMGERLDAAMTSLDTIVKKLRDEDGLEACGIRLTEPASFKGPGGVKQGSLNKLYIEGCVQQLLAARGIAFMPLVEAQIKAAFKSKTKTKDRVGEDPFEGVPGTGGLKEDHFIAMATAVAARQLK